MSYDMIDRFLRNNLDDDNYAEYSAALDELCTPPAQQEPFTYYRHYDGGLQDWPDEKTIPLYTAPPVQRTFVGLTNKDLQPIADEYRILFGGWVEDFARAIEAKLMEKNT